MKPTTSFDKQNLKLIRADLDKSLKEVAEKWGLTSLKAGNISFSPAEFTTKIKATLPPTVESAKQDEKKVKSLLSIFGLPDSFGKTISLQGKRFIISGINTRSRKSPIEIKDINGKGFRISVETAERALKADK